MHHPVFPGKQGPAARRIQDQSDVRDVIALLRLNYERAVARHGPVTAIASLSEPERNGTSLTSTRA